MFSIVLATFFVGLLMFGFVLFAAHAQKVVRKQEKAKRQRQH